MKIAAGPVQKVGAFRVRSGVSHFRLAAREQMRRQRRAARPRGRIVVAVIRIDRRKPCDQALDGALRGRLGIRSCSRHGLHEAMHRHRRRAVLERVMLDERHFGESGERCHALGLVVYCALDERHRYALRRTLGEKRHECFGRRALPYRVVNREIEGRGDAARIARAARCCGNEARCLRRVGGKAHLCPLASGCRMVERERQPAQRLRKRPCARFVAAPGTVLEKGHRFLDRQHVERHLVRPLAPVREARRDQDPRAGRGQEIGNLLGRRRRCRRRGARFLAARRAGAVPPWRPSRCRPPRAMRPRTLPRAQRGWS